MLSFPPIFNAILTGKFNIPLPTPYLLLTDRRARNLAYILADGIYPGWPFFAVPMHDDAKVSQRWYIKLHDAMKNYIHCLFGVMQSQWRFLRRELRLCDVSDFVLVSEVCVILQNFMVRMY